MKRTDGREWAVRLKVWLEVDGEPIIGEGRHEMLQAIHRNGSIIQAAREIGISYRKMRGAIGHMEQSIGHPLVNTRRGGGNGGGAELTPEAHLLIDRYEKVARSL